MKTYKTGAWSKEEEDFIIKNFGKLTIPEISIKLNRTEKQIGSKVGYMRLIGYDIPHAKRRKKTITEREIAAAKAKEKARIKLEKQREQRRLKKERDKEEAIKRKARREERKARLEAEKLQKEAKEMQEIYDAALERYKVIEGVFKEDIKVKLGQSYEVTRTQGRLPKDTWTKLKGGVIQETRDHVTIKNHAITETFLKVDFLIGEFRIKEVS